MAMSHDLLPMRPSLEKEFPQGMELSLQIPGRRFLISSGKNSCYKTQPDI